MLKPYRSIRHISGLLKHEKGDFIQVQKMWLTTRTEARTPSRIVAAFLEIPAIGFAVGQVIASRLQERDLQVASAWQLAGTLEMPAPPLLAQAEAP